MLAHAGYGEFLPDTRMSRLKGKRDDNREVYLLIQFVTVPGTKKLIVNIKL